MSGATSRDQLRTLLAPAVAAEGLDLEDVVVTPAGKRRLVRVVVDRDGGVPLDTVADVSNAIGAVLDESDAFGDAPYVLEVTSPGVDRPLTEPRHWRRNVGRLVRVSVTQSAGDGPASSTNVVARILAVDELGVTLQPEPEDSGKGGKPGAKQGGKPGAKQSAKKAAAAAQQLAPQHVPWSDLGPGKVQVEFGRADADGPADDGAATGDSDVRNEADDADVADDEGFDDDLDDADEDEDEDDELDGEKEAEV